MQILADTCNATIILRSGADAGPALGGARLALVAGDRDIEAGTVGVKDLSNGEQVEVAMDSVVAEVRARLS